MKSLENIYIERTSTHMERGINGIAKQVSRTYKQKLTVRTIGGGLRFVHLIADYLVLYTLLFLISFFLIFFLPAEFAELITSFLLLILLPVYYTLMEYKFQQTAGKMLTGSIVINEFAEKPNFRICLLRTLIRFVPFEGFTCMGTPSRGWHDKWTNTYVVPKKEVAKLKELITKNNTASV